MLVLRSSRTNWRTRRSVCALLPEQSGRSRSNARMLMIGLSCVLIARLSPCNWRSPDAHSFNNNSRIGLVRPKQMAARIAGRSPTDAISSSSKSNNERAARLPASAASERPLALFVIGHWLAMRIPACYLGPVISLIIMQKMLLPHLTVSILVHNNNHDNKQRRRS